jgi:hypothetical protein
MNESTKIDQILTHGLSFFSFGIEDREFEFGSHFRLVTRHQQQVERQVILALLIQAFGIDSQTPANTTTVSRVSQNVGQGRNQDAASARFSGTLSIGKIGSIIRGLSREQKTERERGC